MTESRIKNVSRNTKYGMIYKFIVILFPFIIRTLIIRMLGSDYLGLNSLFTSILSVLSLVELGFGSALIFRMYKPALEKNYVELGALLKFYRTIYRIAGLIVLIIGLAILPFLKNLVHGTYPTDINIYLIYLIYLSNTVISYLFFSYEQSLFNVFQRNDVMFKIMSIVHLLLYFMQMLILIVFKNYYIFVIVLPSSMILNNLIVHFCARKFFPEIFCTGQISKMEKINLLKNVKNLIGHRFGDVIIGSVDNIVISVVLGLSSLAIYNNYYYVVTAVAGIIEIFRNSILASIGNSFLVESKEKILKIFYNLSLFIFWISGWFSILYFCLIQNFMFLWVGSSYIYSSTLTIFLFTCYLYTWKSRIIQLSFKDAAGMWKEDFWKPYIGILIDLVLNFILIYYWGVNGILIATIIVMVFVYSPWEISIIFKNILKTSKKKYLIDTLLYFSWTLISGIICFILTNIIEQNNYVGLILKVLICLFIPNLLFIFMFFWKKEFKYYVGLVFSKIFKQKTHF